jgi:hypothetical protein
MKKTKVPVTNVSYMSRGGREKKEGEEHRKTESLRERYGVREKSKRRKK